MTGIKSWMMSHNESAAASKWLQHIHCYGIRQLLYRSNLQGKRSWRINRRRQWERLPWWRTHLEYINCTTVALCHESVKTWVKTTCNTDTQGWKTCTGTRNLYYAERVQPKDFRTLLVKEIFRKAYISSNQKLEKTLERLINFFWCDSDR